MTAGGERPRRPLDPALQEATRLLNIKVRQVVEGFLGGSHPAAHRGSTVEFAEHKRYEPGDDLRHLDWRAFARTDRHFIKLFAREVTLSCFLVVDRSASMAYQGTRAARSKLDHAVLLAAALGHILVRQGDAVGLVSYGAAPTLLLPVGRRPNHLRTFEERLAGLVPERTTTTDLARALALVSDVVDRRSMVVVLSDLWGRVDDDAMALRRLAARGHDVTVFHLLDPDEVDLPFTQPTRFVGLEGGPEVEVDPTLLRDDYRRAVEAAREAWRRRSGEAGVDYLTHTTAEAPERILTTFAAHRDRMRGAG